MSQIAWMVKRVKNQHLEAREIEFLEFDNQESNYSIEAKSVVKSTYCIQMLSAYETYLAKKSREHVL